jgi:hypothetical protein
LNWSDYFLISLPKDTWEEFGRRLDDRLGRRLDDRLDKRVTQFRVENEDITLKG